MPYYGVLAKNSLCPLWVETRTEEELELYELKCCCRHPLLCGHMS